MEAGDRAAALAERAQGVDAAGKAQRQVQAARRGEVAQQRQRQVVAGVDLEHRQGLVERQRVHALELGAQRLDVRRHPHARLPLGGEQAQRIRRQPRRLALGPDHQRLRQHLLPALERAPDMAVRGTGGRRRMPDRAMLVQRAEQVEQGVVDVGAALAMRLEAVLQVDAGAGHGAGIVAAARRCSRDPVGP